MHVTWFSPSVCVCLSMYLGDPIKAEANTWHLLVHYCEHSIARFTRHKKESRILKVGCHRDVSAEDFLSSAASVCLPASAHSYQGMMCTLRLYGMHSCPSNWTQSHTTHRWRAAFRTFYYYYYYCIFETFLSHWHGWGEVLNGQVLRK